ncbi:MAG TPA: inositol monophosphatase family protein [Candidatus Limnocylindrales bacterium]|nr:inositol monophosphatase family protein [Candidatus Limnocylindrales bacterium]
MSAETAQAWSAGLRRADPADLEAWLRFALGCADVADGLALRGLRDELTVEAKADGSFVTQVDRAIETEIRSRLTERFPDHGVVGEELGSEAGSGGTRWYLDPIDGTHNFMRRVPLFGMLLAVERDGEIQVGVISAPALGMRWWASRGEGAWTVGGGQRDPRRIHVSERDDLGVAQVLFRSVTDMHASRVAAGFDALLPAVWRERGFGDFWGYTLVADGAAEAMMERDLGPWDLAAPWILVEEAGGRITDFDGERSFARGEALATNGRLHDVMLDRLWGRTSGPRRAPAR